MTLALILNETINLNYKLKTKLYNCKLRATIFQCL